MLPTRYVHMLNILVAKCYPAVEVVITLFMDYIDYLTYLISINHYVLELC